MPNYTTNIPIEEKLKINRALRYSRQKISAEYARNTTNHAVKDCMRTMAGSTVSIRKVRSSGRAFYSGLMTCGSVWDCPVCSAKISARRSEEINNAVSEWLSRGFSICMVTYTVSHNLGDRLKDLARAMTDAIRFVHSGAPWQRFSKKFGIRGSITATEILYNQVSGWHYHKHQVLFLEKNNVGSRELREWIYARYEKSIELSGFYSRDGIGVDVSEPTKDQGSLPEYITKWGIAQELTSQEKIGSGLNPFDLLDDKKYASQFIEYSRAMYGKRRLTWSKGLRDILNMSKEIQDEILAQENDYLESEVEILHVFTHSEWKKILYLDLRVQILEKIESDPDGFDVWLYKTMGDHHRFE